MLVLVGWLLILPPITPATEGFYIGPDGRPARLGLEAPLFQWTVYGRYPDPAKCEKMRSYLDSRGLQMNPANANAAAYSFARCIQDSDPRLRPNNGPNELLPNSALPLRPTTIN